MKFICTNKSSVAFNDHIVTLEGEDAIVHFHFKNADHYNEIEKGHEVELHFGEMKTPKAAAKKKTTKKK